MSSENFLPEIEITKNVDNLLQQAELLTINSAQIAKLEEGGVIDKAYDQLELDHESACDNYAKEHGIYDGISNPILEGFDTGETKIELFLDTYWVQGKLYKFPSLRFTAECINYMGDPDVFVREVRIGHYEKDFQHPICADGFSFEDVELATDLLEMREIAQKAGVLSLTRCLDAIEPDESHIIRGTN